MPMQYSQMIMKLFTNLAIAIYFSLFCSVAIGAENVFYLLHASPKHIKNLTQTLEKVRENHQSIQILISQAYKINSKGEVTGFINEEVSQLSKTYSIKLMAMITNAGFAPSIAHKFLSSSSAQTKAMKSILDACKKNNLYGVQFDFEGISIKDKTLLTQFYKNAADALHKEGYKISYAVIPAFKKEMDNSIFLRKTYKNWSGVYDLKALSKSADFITVMAYNQHPDGTIPGPTASVAYTETAIKNVIKDIPADKLSLGIPAYSVYWFSGYSTVSLHNVEISYADANTIIKRNNGNLFWNNKDKINYSVYMHNWLNEYVYLEDVNSFKAKLALVKKYNLRGISVFRIGTEDDRIWALLENKTYV